MYDLEVIDTPLTFSLIFSTTLDEHISDFRFESIVFFIIDKSRGMEREHIHMGFGIGTTTDRGFLHFWGGRKTNFLLQKIKLEIKGIHH